MERFVAILIEHCAGKFPIWLTPDQVKILPISDKFNEYAKELSNVLDNYDIRALIDERAEKIGKKIRDAELDKIPYMLIVGENEMTNGTVSVRKQGEGDLGEFTAEQFAAIVQKEIDHLLSK
jgi:threonyl-tRNA synthetase